MVGGVLEFWSGGVVELSHPPSGRVSRSEGRVKWMK